MTLMTLHNAKGLEYPTVFIVGCEDGVFPHSRALDEGALEEERRLFYVGVTRAMRKLYLTRARRRAVFGAQTYGMRSRFLDELPGELTEETQQTVFRPGGGPAGSGWSGSTSTVGRPGAGQTGWGGPSSSPVGPIVARRGRESQPSADQFRLGDDIVHPKFGDGVVIGLKSDGIVVRFAGDGSERQLITEYAPVTRR